MLRDGVPDKIAVERPRRTWKQQDACAKVIWRELLKGKSAQKYLSKISTTWTGWMTHNAGATMADYHTDARKRLCDNSTHNCNQLSRMSLKPFALSLVTQRIRLPIRQPFGCKSQVHTAHAAAYCCTTVCSNWSQLAMVANCRSGIYQPEGYRR